jgi:hypothetical protein
MHKLFSLVTMALTTLALQGCIAVTVVEIAAETIEAGVEITGAVVGSVVDVITPEDEEDSSDDD